MADGIVKGRGISTEGLAAINFILAENDGSLRLERQGAGFRTRFVSRPTQPIALLGTVAEAAADLLSAGRPHLIRRCENPDCVFFFYDSTRNHRRQWCAMASCGNLMKVRAFRKRQRR
jgi:predicted RNA-binding Zn ribbon-like protein